ncbi:unnamed protein product, partial [Cuscuta europaea]
MIGYADLQSGLYIYNTSKLFLSNKLSLVNSANIPSLDNKNDVWHYRLGHLPFNKLKSIVDCTAHPHMNKNILCDICHFAKQKRLPFPDNTSYASHAFDLVHMDVWGPFRVQSYSGFRYFLTIVDDHTRCTWVFMMKTKSEVKFHMMNFYNLINTQFHTKIKIIRTDNGTEFIFPNFYNTHGIIHQLSCVET